MMRKQRHAMPLIVLLGLELGVVLGLQAMGSIGALQIPWSNLSTWLASSTLDDLAAPLLYGAALVIAWWLFISTALCVLAQLSRVPFAVDLASRFTLPAVRRVVDGALVISIASSSFVGLTATMASADNVAPDGSQITLAANQTQTNNPSAQNSVSTPGTGAPASDTMPSGTSGSTTPNSVAPSSSTTTSTSTSIPASTSSTTVPSTTSSTTPASNPQTVAPDSGTNWVQTPSPGAPDSSAKAPATAPATPSAPTQVLGAQDHKVVPGDNLWTIARDALASNSNRSAKSISDSEVRTYWLKLIDANKDSLRSKDPHWIFPGEVIKLPDMGTPAAK